MKKLCGFIIVFVSALIICGVFSGVAFGCAGPFYVDYVSFFEFSLADDPLFNQYHYYEISPPIGPLEVKSAAKREYYDNLVEWQQFFNMPSNPPGSMDEIEKLIYDSKNKGILVYILQCLKDNIKVNRSQMGNLAGERLLEYIIRNKQTDALEYIIYAKDCEPWVTKWDPWEDPPQRDFQEMQRLINLGLERYTNAASDFIKLRHAYQVIRLAHYTGQLEKCIAYYDQLVPVLDVKSIIAYWAMGHKEGALRTVGRQAESLVLDSLIFDQCPNMMESAYRDFFIPDDAIWLTCLNSVSNNHRKATLWMLRGLKEERLTLEPIKNMFTLEPNSSRLEMMLVREINRVEQQYLDSAAFFPVEDKNAPKDYGYVRQLKAFAIDGASSGRIRQPGLWYLAAGYLSLIMGDFSQATLFLEKAEAVNDNTNALRQQIALVKNLDAIAISSVISPQIEETSFTNLTWAGGLVYDFNNQAVYRSLLLLLGQKYLASGEIAKAACCFTKAGYQSQANFLVDIYSANSDLERMAALMQKKDKNKLETFLVKFLKYSVDDIRYIKATKLMRQEKFREALNIYRRLPVKYWDKYRNPRLPKRDDYWFNDPCEYTRGLWTNFEREAFDLSKRYSWLTAAEGKKVRFYTRLDFAAKVVALQDKAKGNPKNAAKYYFEIANGFFHTPFWGYNDPVWQGNLVNGSYFPGYPFNVLDFAEKYHAKEDEFNKEYGTRALALKYYRKAITTAKNKEMAARSATLAYLCQHGFAPENKNDDQAPDGTFFDLLRKDYAGTKVYQKLIEECSTLKEYLGGK